MFYLDISLLWYLYDLWLSSCTMYPFFYECFTLMKFKLWHGLGSFTFVCVLRSDVLYILDYTFSFCKLCKTGQDSFLLPRSLIKAPVNSEGEHWLPYFMFWENWVGAYLPSCLNLIMLAFFGILMTPWVISAPFKHDGWLSVEHPSLSLFISVKQAIKGIFLIRFKITRRELCISSFCDKSSQLHRKCFY